MKTRPLLCLTASVCLVLMPLRLPGFAQGGTYSGPGGASGLGDTVPPSTPTPSGGGTSTGGTTPDPSGASPGQPTAPTAGVGLSEGSIQQLDLSHWTFWWYFNRDRLLNMRTRSLRTRWVQGVPIQNPAALSADVIETSVLPLLVELAGARQDAPTRASALIALARDMQPGDLLTDAVLRAAWDAPDALVRECATLALGITGRPAGLEKLAKRLLEGPEQDLSPKVRDRTRAFAAYGLGVLCSKAERPEIASWATLVLTSVLERESESLDLRVACALALGHVNLPWKPGAAPSSTGSRNGLVLRLLELEKSAETPLLQAHLLTSCARLVTPLIPSDLLATLAKTMEARTLPGQSPIVAQSATTALGLIGERVDEDHAGSLVTILARLATQGGQAPVRQLAWIALAELRSGPFAARIDRILEQQLTKAGPQDQPWICLATGMLGFRLEQVGRELPAPLLLSLRAHLGSDQSPDAQDAAILALGLARDQGAIEGLSRLLEDASSKRARALAALALGLIGHQPAVGAIAKLLPTLEADQLSLENAAMGLALLDRTLASKLLTQALQDAPSPNSASFIAAAMGRSGDRSSLAALQETLESRRVSSWARTYAAVAIGILAERDTLPWRSILAWRSPYQARTESLYDGYGRGVLNLL